MDADVLKSVSLLWESLDSPRSLACYLQAKYEEWDQLAGMRVDPGRYLDSESFFRDAQATEILRKADFLPLKVDRRLVACEEFRKTERQCCETNTRLDRWITLRTFESAGDHALYSFIERVQRRIKRVLGRLPDEIFGKFGPGATFESRGNVTLGEKIQELTCTEECVDLLPFVERTAWGRALLRDNRWNPSIVRGNRFTTVPKDANKDRGICVEPGVNVFLQLGVGRHIRVCLRRIGIDLDEGQPVHALMACEGSLSGDYSTIDLSSASDTVCTNLVRLLLPPEWFEVLDALRSRRTWFEGNWHFNQKFSSMGNGFTFELETLIFYAISKEACGGRATGDLWVYGDDIIVPTIYFQEVISALRYFGFTPNPRKSFGSGYFRESCGGDYFNGVDVRPFYLKELPSEPHEWIAFHNGLVRTFESVKNRRRLTKRARDYIIGRIPRSIRSCIGDSRLGDLVLESEASPTVRFIADGTGSEVPHVRAWVPYPKYRSLSRYSPDTQLALILYGVPSSGLLPRDAVSGYGFRWVPYPDATSKWLPCPLGRSLRRGPTDS
jgi:hypothetical protein